MATTLCLYCRTPGHPTSLCHRWTSPTPKPTFDKAQEAALLASYRAASSNLCLRCAAYPLLEKCSLSTLMDESAYGERMDLYSNQTHTLTNDLKRQLFAHTLHLGEFKSLDIRSDCPLCRLIFYVFPTDELDEQYELAERAFYLRPFPAYDRQSNSERDVPAEVKAKYAVWFGVVTSERESQARMTELDSMVMRDAVNDAFSLSVAPGFRDERLALRARPVDPTVDYARLRHWLKQCAESHDTHCRRTWDDALIPTTRMIDVQARRVVPCPSPCEYVALSYVWGGIHPADGALEAGTLPKTIEDAITVTKGLGCKYLWVDALCVDQKPTPQQKTQLAMMDVIYSCAMTTIIAVSGKHSNTGLPGVSLARVPQAVDGIEGRDFRTVGPVYEAALYGSEYWTRAWTVQEIFFACCRLIFARDQVHFLCNSSAFCEAVDEETDPGGYLRGPRAEGTNALKATQALQSQPSRDESLPAETEYRSTLALYTERRMTHDSDSLNAFRGILHWLRKSCFSADFVCGLPLREFPQALRWFHPWDVKPKRRPAFPSWSWAGWAGRVTYSDPLDLMRRVKPKMSRREDLGTDRVVRFVDIDADERVLTVEATVIRLDIRCEPFSEAFVPGTDEMLGIVRERNSPHHNTLTTGMYDFLVVERLRLKNYADGPVREYVYMLLLEWDGDVAMRVTKVRLFVELGLTLERAAPVVKTIRMK
ncbi:HET-domain-containing protein [Trichodelitschia bisporula]|uniref:HET-domain-containing protein n=1 Tax=Trichodelitschia bisporula TaxID=703511 RepID=A0A6G1HMG1_9PEZI|nr:HET-domain-containing protein [Trichodelitschia bisporula]